MHKSENDKREYDYFILDNKLKVCVVHDAECDKSAAALDVIVGNLYDPKEIPGLAHFLEHMLFLGTEKYPEENCFSKFLAQNGGSSNAYTSSEHTNYYFDVQSESFKEALEIWCHFFICPLFNPTSQDKEVIAVNAEHDKNLQQDFWRLHQLDKWTSNQEHPYSNFGTGNMETLGVIPRKLGLVVRDELKKFYKKYYSANLMSLCLVGKESLSELKEMATTLFSGVSNKDVIKPELKGEPYLPEHLKKIYKVIPVKKHHTLEVCFLFCDARKYYREKPSIYIAHLIGHEGPGSLLALLKKKGWATGINAGDCQSTAGVFGTFRVYFDLTEEGLESFEEIVVALFQYLNLLKRELPQEWIFQECKSLGEIHFRFKDKERPDCYASTLASNMHYYPKECLLGAPYLFYEYNPELIVSCLRLLTPEALRLTVVSPLFQGHTTEIESIYGTQYSSEDIDPELLVLLSTDSPNEELFLPSRNNFIPTNFEIVPLDNQHEHPVLVSSEGNSQLWFKQDDKFFLPKAIVLAGITSKAAYLNPTEAVLSHLFVEILKDNLAEYAYDALLAGVYYHLENTTSGLSLNVQGYNHKLKELLEKVIGAMKDFRVEHERFGPIRSKLKRRFENFAAEQGYSHCIYNMHYVCSERLWTHEHKLAVIEDITVEQVEAFVRNSLLKRVHTRVFIHGNYSIKGAKDVFQAFEPLVHPKVHIPLEEYALLRHIKYTSGKRFVYRINETVNAYSAIENYYVVGPLETRASVLLELLSQFTQENFFHQLRTNEQLGYIVHATSVLQPSGILGMRFVVQSEKPPYYLQSRVDNFLRHTKEELESLTAEEFQKGVDTLTKMKMEKFKNLNQEASLYWLEIIGDHYEFDKAERDIEELKKISKCDLIKFYEEKVHPDAVSGCSISVWSHSCTAPFDSVSVPDEWKQDNVVYIEDVPEFKKNYGLFERPKSYSFVALERQ
ncbi:insulin-degrading enzyme-like [Zophobas morio]|uniref:insulin-degrading enzyme-like n=1 Tax=Zophobas morio TaxID=2755281 RepID=UPI003083B4E2